MARAVADITKRSTAINFTLPLELLAHMDELAARSGVSRSEFLRGLIEQALEDAEDVAVAKERLADEADGWVSLDGLRTATKA
ncbi:MAG: ribbon-helix-helix domain-containing protein [Armatimonadetes bacterium]|nr:ribbon-helix-helix domain-containing protein [Armatimonadota bacterium]